MSCKEKKECICCGSEELELVLDLNDQPLANSYHDNTESQSVFPLKLNVCTRCYHLQLSHIVDPDLMFKDYLYVSGTSQTLRDYFSWFANFAVETYIQTHRFGFKPRNVLDIACNDGSQLDSFENLGLNTFGVDPAENLHEISSKRHSVVCDYFDSSTVDGKYDIITAQNVFAHNENGFQFLKDCKQIMEEESLLFIQVSQADMVKENQFDTIYHEHLSFFCIKSFKALVDRSGLNLVDVIKTPVHGNSFVFTVSKRNINRSKIENSLFIEQSEGLHSLETYHNYAEKCKNITKEFVSTVQSFRSDGYKIIGYGAAAKGITFLNFAGTDLDYIVDDNSMKHNLYTPGRNIVIKHPDAILEEAEDSKLLFVPLAWNFFKEIKNKILSRRNKESDKFLTYFPEVKVA